MKKVKINVQFKPETGYSRVVLVYMYDEKLNSWTDPLYWGYSKITGFFEKGFVHDEFTKGTKSANFYPISNVVRMNVSVEDVK